MRKSVRRLKSFNYFIPVFCTFQKIIFEGMLLYREKEGSLEGREAGRGGERGRQGRRKRDKRGEDRRKQQRTSYYDFLFQRNEIW